MVCNEFMLIKEENGKKYIIASIYADSTPASMPEDGSDVNMSADYMFLPGSTIYVVGNGDVYMMSPNGNWTKQ